MSTVLYVVACEISLLVTFTISVIAWQRRKEIGAFSFFVLTISQASWTFGIIAETISPTLEGKIFWDNFQFIGWMLASSGILAFTYEFTTQQRRKWIWPVGLIIPILATVLAYTDPLHHLIRPTAQLVEEFGLVSLDYEFTTTMYGLALYSYLTIIVALVILSRHMAKMPPAQRPSIGFMVVGMVIPIAGGLLSLAGVLPPALRDISPFTFGASSLIIGISLLRYQLFDINRFARELIIETMNTSVITLDTQNKLSLMNQAATRSVGLEPTNVGKPAPGFLVEWLTKAQEARQHKQPFVAKFQKDSQDFFFDVNATRLVDNRNNFLGEALIANDITRRLQIEQQLVERTRELEKQSELARRNAEKLSESNQRAQRRADQLQALAEVSRSIARIENLEQLLPAITKVISEKFDFYHVGVFLTDDTNTYAILSAANSEGGQRMLARSHRLRVGEVGIVGFVTGSGRPRIALDTGADAVHFKNPDLPDTHSEMALPLLTGTRIIGALDVQSTEINAFSEQDVEVLSTLSDQVTIAILNARRFEETQKALAEAEAIYRQSLKEQWSHAGASGRSTTGFRYNILGSQPLDEESINEEVVTKVLASGEMQIEEKEESATIAVPIKLRGELIGILNVRTPGGHTFDQNEIDVVRAVADRVAISAENARLFEETTSRAERERTVADITNKIRATNDPQEMITTALEELKRALNVNRIQIVPYSASNQQP